MYIITFDQIRKAMVCPEQKTINAITEFKETNELWIKCRITEHEMNIALWEGINDFFKIEIINLKIDSSYKFAINTTEYFPV